MPQPYYNEPGYEASMGTPKGNADSLRYNCVIREATIRYAMIDHLQVPPPDFCAFEVSVCHGI